MAHDLSKFGFREKKTRVAPRLNPRVRGVTFGSFPGESKSHQNVRARRLLRDVKDVAKETGEKVARFGRKVVRKLNTKVSFVKGDASNLEKYRKLKSAGWKRLANKTWRSPKGKSFSNMQAAYKSFAS